MRLSRWGFIFFALYLVFIGGSAYYTNIFAVRIFHHVIITLTFSLWLLRKLLRKEGLPKTPLDIPLYLGVIVWLLSALFSLDTRLAFEHTWFLILHVLILIVLMDLLQHKRTLLVVETQFILGAVVIMMSVFELSVWYFVGTGEFSWFQLLQENGILLPLALPPRLQWAMSSTNWLAAYVAPMAILAMGWAVSARRRSVQYTFVILSVSMIIILLLTRTRGGFISILTALVIIVILRILNKTSRQQHQQNLLIGLGIFGAIVAGSVLIILISRDPSRLAGDAQRLDLYRSAVEITVDHPVLGVGAGVYGRALRSYRDPAYADDRLAATHNGYLSTAAESGLIGILISLWLGILIVRRWYQNWRQAATPAQKIRLEFTLAAFFGIGAHSLVDVFQMTSVVTLILFLIAYNVIGEPDLPIITKSSRTRQLLAGITLVILVTYGGWWVLIVDRAHGAYQAGLMAEGNPLPHFEEAASIDPDLNLYQMSQLTYIGEQGINNPQQLNEAESAYQEALVLEPTWDDGWLNLAAIAEIRGDYSSAYEYAQKALSIHARTSAIVVLARNAERIETDSLTRADVINAYRAGMAYSLRVPVSDYWQQSPMMIDALVEQTSIYNREARYRMWRQLNPNRLVEFIPESPSSAPDYWVLGEVAYEAGNDEKAVQHFTQAIEIEPGAGDYYASRARALVNIDPEATKRDAQIAILLGTSYEFPYVTLAQLTTNPDEEQRYMLAGLPRRVLNFNFSGVLYAGRRGVFETYPNVRFSVYSQQELQPWFDYANDLDQAGNNQLADDLRTAIYDLAPHLRPWS